MFRAADRLAANAVMRIYGSPIAVTVDGIVTELTAVYLAPASQQNQSPNRSPYPRPDHRVLFKADELDMTGAAEGSTVTVEDRNFYIANLERDDTTIVTATVRPV